MKVPDDVSVFKSTARYHDKVQQVLRSLDSGNGGGPCEESDKLVVTETTWSTGMSTQLVVRSSFVDLVPQVLLEDVYRRPLSTLPSLLLSLSLSSYALSTSLTTTLRTFTDEYVPKFSDILQRSAAGGVARLMVQAADFASLRAIMQEVASTTTVEAEII